MLDDEQLKEWRALAEAATPGPWTAGGAAVFKTVPFEANTNLWTTIATSTPKQGDADFIAAARTALPALLDEVERLRGQLEHAATENLAFNVKAAQQINEARAERDRMRPVVEAAEAWRRWGVQIYEPETNLGRAVDAYRAAPGKEKV